MPCRDLWTVARQRHSNGLMKILGHIYCYFCLKELVGRYRRDSAGLLRVSAILLTARLYTHSVGGFGLHLRILSSASRLRLDMTILSIESNQTIQLNHLMLNQPLLARYLLKSVEPPCVCLILNPQQSSELLLSFVSLHSSKNNDKNIHIVQCHCQPYKFTE